MSDESASGSDPDLDPDVELEDAEEEEEEEVAVEEHDRDDEEDLLDDPSLEHAQLGEDGQRPPRCTSTTSSQSEPSEQLRHQGTILASEDPKKKRAQKPSHMRRNIR